MEGYYRIRREAFDILSNHLPGNLYYHGMPHTVDVLNVCNGYIRRKKIPAATGKLLRLGAILHDIGFSVTYENHEETGAQLARHILKKYNLPKQDINVVINLILATRVPQTPQTLLQKIICDADLDYLGRDDYPEISENLYQELWAYNKIGGRKKWRKMQIRFLDAHNYHTSYARKNREPGKQRRLRMLKNESK